jgi:hypothetical protein
MQITKNKLYVFLLLACFLGYVWIVYAMHVPSSKGDFHFCFIKSIINVPCPSCGTTRSLMALAIGEFENAFYWNPLGYLIGSLMILLPLWIITDFILKSSSCYLCYEYLASRLLQKKYTFPVIILILINWYWNIKKGL